MTAAGAPGLTPELDEAIRRGYAQRDRANMAPTIAARRALTRTPAAAWRTRCAAPARRAG